MNAGRVQRDFFRASEREWASRRNPQTPPPLSSPAPTVNSMSDFALARRKIPTIGDAYAPGISVRGKGCVLSLLAHGFVCWSDVFVPALLGRDNEVRQR